MPWSVRKDSRCSVSKPWGVIKGDGSLEGCHTSAELARRQQRALYASEGKEVDMDETKELGTQETEEKGMYGYTSFEEIDVAERALEMSMKMQQTVNQFSHIASNIVTDPEISDKAEALSREAIELTKRISDIKPDDEKTLFEKVVDWFKAAPTKTEGGVKYKKSDYAYAPSDEPGDWKLRLAEGRSGNITVAQLGRAAAAFSSGGFRGNKVQLPSGAVGSVKARIRREYKKLGVKPDEVPDAVKDVSEFMLWKEGESWRWLAIYSNKFRDRDNPPEILSSFAHKEFADSLEKGEWEYPELWTWHVKGSTWGKTDWVYFDEETGFALAAGYATDGRVAEAMSELCQTEDIAVSHGMPTKEIQRSMEDPSVIVRYRSREISPVPRDKAANVLTDFTMQGGMEMIPDDKKAFLIRAGYDEDRIREIEEKMQKDAEKAQALGLEFKETETVEEQAEEQTEEQIEEQKEETSDVAPETVEETPEKPLTRQEVFEAFAQLAESFSKSLDAITAKIEQVGTVVSELKQTEDEKIEQKVQATPAASLTDMLRARSVIGTEETKIDGRTSLAKQKPKETEVPLKGPTGIPFLDQFYTQVGSD